MLEVIGFSLWGFLWQLLGHPPHPRESLELFPWHDAVIFELPPEESSLIAQNIVNQYLQSLTQQGIASDRQGVWLQSDWTELGDFQGKIPVSAASLTKIATTLAVLDKLGVEHQFITKVYYTGSIKAGVLQGDLVIEGDRDPFFVWEEAIAISNALNQLGIREITGNLLVNEQFYMNYKSDPQISAELLKQGLQTHLWSSEIEKQFLSLPIMTPRPQLKIQGKIAIISSIPLESQLLLSHQSLPLVDIVRQMNIYSNNYIAQMLADIVGGASAIANYASQVTGVAPHEIQLINGSGLGIENRLSPRAVTKMLMTIDNLLQPHNLNVMDLFPVAGRDQVGTMENRQLPTGVAIKTGTLNQVSALAGVMPLKNQRRVWFAVVNHGWQIEQFRHQQDQLLQQLANHWQSEIDSTQELIKATPVYLGDPLRNQIKQ